MNSCCAGGGVYPDGIGGVLPEEEYVSRWQWRTWPRRCLKRMVSMHGFLTAFHPRGIQKCGHSRFSTGLRAPREQAQPLRLIPVPALFVAVWNKQGFRSKKYPASAVSVKCCKVTFLA